MKPSRTDIKLWFTGVRALALFASILITLITKNELILLAGSVVFVVLWLLEVGFSGEAKERQLAHKRDALLDQAVRCCDSRHYKKALKLFRQAEAIGPLGSQHKKLKHQAYRKANHLSDA